MGQVSIIYMKTMLVKMTILVMISSFIFQDLAIGNISLQERFRK